MINLVGNTAKQKYRTQMEKRWTVYQNAFMLIILSILRKQYKAAAENIASYNLDYNFAIIKYNKELRNAFRNHYMKVLIGFGEGSLDEVSKMKGFENYECKSFVEDFWRFATPWINQNTGTRVTQVTETTKRNINKIVKREMEKDHSNAEIAKQIEKIAEISLPFRAKRIARTETHTAANYATDRAMDSSRLMKEKSWLSALDERTRTIFRGADFDHVFANGERVAMDDSFKRTGENLMFPGDFNGSAGNVVNCRCVALYYTNVQTGGAE